VSPRGLKAGLYIRLFLVEVFEAGSSTLISAAFKGFDIEMLVAAMS